MLYAFLACYSDDLLPREQKGKNDDVLPNMYVVWNTDPWAVVRDCKPDNNCHPY